MWSVERSALLARIGAATARAYWRLRGADRLIVDATRTSRNLNAIQVYRVGEWARALARNAALRPTFDALRLCPEAATATARSYLEPRAEHDLVAQSQLGMLAARQGHFDMLAAAYQGRIDAEMNRVIQEGSHPEKRLPATAMADLERVVDTLTDAGLRPYVVSGTLLGLYRDGELLPWDFDHDVGVGPGVDVASVKAIFDEDRRFFAVERGHCVTVRDLQSGVTTDIFVHFERNGLFWKGTEIHEWWHEPFSTVEATFDEKTFLIPDDPVRYLVENYGDDWHEPKPFYRTTFDTPNRVYRQTPEALIFLGELALQSVRSGDRFAAESTIRSLRDHFAVELTTPSILPAHEHRLE